jgi:hypothetical protein
MDPTTNAKIAELRWNIVRQDEQIAHKEYQIAEKHAQIERLVAEMDANRSAKIKFETELSTLSTPAVKKEK